MGRFSSVLRAVDEVKVEDAAFSFAALLLIVSEGIGDCLDVLVNKREEFFPSEIVEFDFGCDDPVLFSASSGTSISMVVDFEVEVRLRF